MARRKRSGLTNDSRVYAYGKCCNHSPIKRKIIRINNIATFFQGNWIVNERTVILTGQSLMVSVNISLLINYPFTNNGSIVNNGTIDSITEIINSGVGIITNNGTINTLGFSNYDGGIINNSINGTINNPSNCRIHNEGIINNSGTINNSGVFDNGGTGLINNTNNSIITNNHTINNVHIINNNSGSVIDNKNGSVINNNGSAIIYNNSNATIINNTGATFLNNGIINNADGTSLCGTGHINQLSAITGIEGFGTECPPP